MFNNRWESIENIIISLHVNRWILEWSLFNRKNREYQIREISICSWYLYIILPDIKLLIIKRLA